MYLKSYIRLHSIVILTVHLQIRYCALYIYKTKQNWTMLPLYCVQVVNACTHKCDHTTKLMWEHVS